MIPKQKSKLNLRILNMLREKGAPSMSPFPGGQGFQSEDMDEDQYGEVVRGKSEELVPSKKKKKKQPEDEDFELAQESVNIIGKP